MCMLTVFPMPGLLDDKTIERLSNGAQTNDDGHGWSVIVGSQILTGKSMDAGTAIEGFARAYSRATGPALFHSRWATHGGTNVTNVHPFPVRKIKDTYVAHNGIMPPEAHPEQFDPRSDTRIFADEILPQRFRHLDSPTTRERLDKWLGGNKIAILTTNRKYDRQLYVFGLERGYWEDGVWFSNDDYEGRTYRWTYGLRGAGSYHNEYADTECYFCERKSVDDYGYCTACSTCQDCLEPMRTCMCWSGSSSGSSSTTKDDDTTDSPMLVGDEPSIADIGADEAAYRDWLRTQANEDTPGDSPANLVPSQLWLGD